VGAVRSFWFGRAIGGCGWGLAFIALGLPLRLAASDWQIGPCGRGGLCPGSYTPLPTPTSTPTPNPNVTYTPWPTPDATATPLANAFILRVDVGSATGGTDSQGALWSADQPDVSGNAYGYLDNGPAYEASGTVDLTSDPWIYLSFREAPLLHYQVNVAPGTYQVTLLFAEFVAQAPGQRVMNITLQGVAQGSPIDIYADVQGNRALQESYQVTVASGPLDIQVAGQTGTAVLSGLEVVGLQSGGSPTETETPTATPSPTSTPTPSPTPAPGQPITLQLLEPAGAQLLP
jgi:Malectin domain